MTNVPVIDPRLLDLHDQVESHFGSALTLIMLESGAKVVRGVLYDAIAFLCRIDEPTGAFGAAIAIGDGQWTSTVFGEHIAQDRAPEAIARSLDLIHEYARLILPEAYLERFAAGVENSDSHSTG